MAEFDEAVMQAMARGNGAEVRGGPSDGSRVQMFKIEDPVALVVFCRDRSGAYAMDVKWCRVSRSALAEMLEEGARNLRSTPRGPGGES